MSPLVKRTDRFSETDIDEEIVVMRITPRWKLLPCKPTRDRRNEAHTEGLPREGM